MDQVKTLFFKLFNLPKISKYIIAYFIINYFSNNQLTLELLYVFLYLNDALANNSNDSFLDLEKLDIKNLFNRSINSNK